MARKFIENMDEKREEPLKEAKEILEKSGQVYDFAEYERQREIVEERINEFSSIVRKAVSLITILPSAGRPKKLDLLKRAHLFFLTGLFNKSNRDTKSLLGSLLQPFIAVEISYKYIERLYADDQVKMLCWILNNVNTSFTA